MKTRTDCLKIGIVRLALCCFAATILYGCAASDYHMGLRKIKSKEYDRAIAHLQWAEADAPSDFKVKRELGIAYYKKNELDAALERFAAAKELQPSDAKTAFYMGMAYEQLGRIEDAKQEYGHYMNLTGSRRFKKAIKTRIKQLSNEIVTQAVAQAIQQEAAIDINSIPPNTIAVLAFNNLDASPELQPLSKGLAQLLITDLSKVKDLQVVERLKLQKLLEELKLGTTKFADSGTAPRIGKLVGAQKIVQGGYTGLAGDNLRIAVALAETETAKLKGLSDVSGKMARFFQLTKQLAFSVIDDYGIVLTREEREAIQKIPTESLLAFMAYSRGLDFEDQGKFSQAKMEYEKAVSFDSRFDLARESLEEIETTERAERETITDLDILEEDLEPEFDEPEVDVKGRLVNTGAAAQTGQTNQGNDTREPVEEVTGITGPVPSASVPIRVDLPN